MPSQQTPGFSTNCMAAATMGGAAASEQQCARLSKDPNITDRHGARSARVKDLSTAGRAVAHTAELLELVLQHVKGRQLFAIQRVCRAFRNTIKGSTLLQSRMLLRRQPTADEDIMDEPSTSYHVFELRDLILNGTLSTEFIAPLSPFGKGGSAKQLRCLRINAPCPLCMRSLDPKPKRSRFRKHKPPSTQEAPTAQASDDCWRRIKLTRYDTCTVAMILRPYTISCRHFYAARKRVVEFPAGTGTLGDLEKCLQRFSAYNETDIERDRRHFGNQYFPTYVWANGEMQAQVVEGMSNASMQAAYDRSSSGGHSYGCTLL